MPILNCYTSNKNLSPEKWNQLVRAWAEQIGVNPKDISIHIVSDFIQIGAKYELKAELYLPSLWPESAIDNIQQNFLNLAFEILEIRKTDIFLMTQVIQSGHVIDRGNIEHW